MGHRGNPQVAQENSMCAIKGVQPYGADGFEVDVFMTKDRELVCFHDQNTLVSAQNTFLVHELQ